MPVKAQKKEKIKTLETGSFFLFRRNLKPCSGNDFNIKISKK